MQVKYERKSFLRGWALKGEQNFSGRKWEVTINSLSQILSGGTQEILVSNRVEGKGDLLEF